MKQSYFPQIHFKRQQQHNLFTDLDNSIYSLKELSNSNLNALTKRNMEIQSLLKDYLSKSLERSLQKSSPKPRKELPIENLYFTKLKLQGKKINNKLKITQKQANSEKELKQIVDFSCLEKFRRPLKLATQRVEKNTNFEAFNKAEYSLSVIESPKSIKLLRKQEVNEHKKITKSPSIRPYNLKLQILNNNKFFNAVNDQSQRTNNTYRLNQYSDGMSFFNHSSIVKLSMAQLNKESQVKDQRQNIWKFEKGLSKKKPTSLVKQQNKKAELSTYLTIKHKPLMEILRTESQSNHEPTFPSESKQSKPRRTSIKVEDLKGWDTTNHIKSYFDELESEETFVDTKKIILK